MEADTSKSVQEDEHPTHVESSSTRINLNDYKGFEPPLGVSSSIDRVLADISPQEFFEKYVRVRKPVIIEQHLKDLTWKGSLWSNKYLKDKAGDTEVLVEKRSDDRVGMFGLSAPKVSMKYGEFLGEIEKKSEQYYLTTQDLERFQDDLDEFDMPKAVLAEPLKSLKEDFPICPSLLGKLITYQVSLWQGNSGKGASSGLHHDFHDNLYVLLRGRKRFRLFPPSAAANMSTMGWPIKIHANGLIVYQSQAVNPTVNVRADGVPLAFLARRKRIEAEQELAIAEEEMYSIQDSVGISESVKKVEIKRLQGIILDCEDRIDLAMEEMLQYGNTFDYDYSSDADVISVHGDDSETDEDDDGTSKGANGKDRSDVDVSVNKQPPTKVMRLANGSRAVVRNGKGDNDNDAEKVVKIPDHFCNIVLPTDTDDPEVILSNFPRKDVVGCLNVVVKPGEMLYLPASWFHEVTSYSDGALTEDDDCQGHLALNYWMYPPDGETFDLPYRDDFWPKRWEAIQEEKDGIFTLSNRPRIGRAIDSSDVINLDTDSDEESGDFGDSSIDAIVVGDDSLLDTTGENDDSVVIETQTSQSQVVDNSTIVLDTTADLSSSVGYLDNGKLFSDDKDSDGSVSDGILDSSDDDESETDGAKGGLVDDRNTEEFSLDSANSTGPCCKKTVGDDSTVALESRNNHITATEATEGVKGQQEEHENNSCINETDGLEGQQEGHDNSCTSVAQQNENAAGSATVAT